MAGRAVIGDTSSSTATATASSLSTHSPDFTPSKYIMAYIIQPMRYQANGP